MKAPKDPGIAIQEIRLVRSIVEMAESGPDVKTKYNLCLIDLGRFESEDGKDLALAAGFDLTYAIKDPLFKFTCHFIARYTRRKDGMAWKDFTSAIALAHIIPYLREFVSNITNRLPAPVLMLPAINTHAMIAEYEKRKRRAKASAQAPQKPA